MEKADGSSNKKLRCSWWTKINTVVTFMTILTVLVIGSVLRDDDADDEGDSTVASRSSGSSTKSRVSKIVCLGGSSTAGGGGIEQLDQYPSLLHQRLDLPVLNHAHGTTDSFYAALHFSSLVPPDADLITWEYAINDSSEHVPTNDIFDSVLFFMRQVALHPNRPALVFIFLWDYPFQVPRPGRRVYDALIPLLANHTIVDVNRWVRRQCRVDTHCDRTDFVADQHHMNEVLHEYVANELVTIVQEMDYSERNDAPVDFEPALFGESLPSNIRTTSLLFDAPTLSNVSGYDLTTAMADRAAPNRIDRMRFLELPDCYTDGLTMDIRLHPHERLSHVGIGPDDDKDGLVRLTWSNFDVDFVEAERAIGPSFHSFFNLWFQPTGDEIIDSGQLSVCYDSDTVTKAIRWIAVLIETDMYLADDEYV
jgi:hypothetical protein